MEIAGQKYIDTPQDFVNKLASWQKFYLGLSNFYHHSYKRPIPKTQTIWQLGSSTLKSYEYQKNRPNLLIIPSLINRAYILDLKQDNSLIRFLAADVNVILLEWDHPQKDELSYNLSDYIVNRVLPAIKFLENRYDNINLLGYCLGGLMALAASCFSKKISSLILLATPWDFSPMRNLTWQIFSSYIPKAFQELVGEHPKVLGSTTSQQLDLQPVYQDTISFVILQNWFYQHNFPKIFKKFADFADVTPTSKQAENFVAIETWARDGLNVNFALFAQLLNDFIGKNIALSGDWSILGQKITPSIIKIPSFMVMPEYDNIVPISSSKFLAESLANNQKLIIPTAHVGMIVGSRAQELLWHPLKRWVLAN